MDQNCKLNLKTGNSRTQSVKRIKRTASTPMAKNPEPSEENLLKIVEMNKICAFHRGQVINFATLLEDAFDGILTEYFCYGSVDKQGVMYNVFLSSDIIMLSNKVKMVNFIYQRYFPEFDLKYNGVSPSLKTRLQNFYVHRNKFAHRKYTIEDSDLENFDGDNITFRFYDGKSGDLNKTELLLNENTVDIYANEMKSLLDIMLELKELIIKREGQLLLENQSSTDPNR